MVQDWDIKPRGHVCASCSTEFEDGAPCFSALVFGQEQGYTRGDYCSKCWPEKGKAALPFSAWQGLYKKPAPPPPEALKKETAEELLRRLMEKDDPSQRNVLYILAVMLERKRILVERDLKTREDGVLIRVYEHKGTGETFLVPDPKLGFDQLEQVQMEVIAMLGGIVTPAGAAVPAEAAASEGGTVVEGESQTSSEEDEEETDGKEEDEDDDDELEEDDEEDEFDDDDDDDDEDDEDDDEEDDDDDEDK